MALRDRFVALAAAGAVALVPVAATLAPTQSFAQEATPIAQQHYEAPVFSSMEDVRGHEAFTDGVVFQVAPRSLGYMAASPMATILYEDYAVNVAIVEDPANVGKVVIYLDGRTSEKMNLDEHVANINGGSILSVLGRWAEAKRTQAHLDVTAPQNVGG